MKRSRFDFQSTAERGLTKADDDMTQKQINQKEPDLNLPSFILPNQSNSLNLSVQLTRKMNSQNYSPSHQSKVLNDSQMTKLLLPQIDHKIPVLLDNQVNLQQSFQLYGLKDENLGFYHNFLNESSYQYKDQQKYIKRQSTYTQNQFYLNHSPRKRQYSFQINNNFKSNLDITKEKEDSQELEDSIQKNVDKNNLLKELEIQSDEDEVSNPMLTQTILKVKTKVQSIKFKVFVIMIRAIFRMIILIRPKKQKWIKNQQIFSQLCKLFKFKDQLVQNKIKQWTQISLTKVLSVLRYSTLKQWNFLDSNIEVFQKDMAITNFLNLCSHLISNLEITTQTNFFLPELGYQSHLEQFVEYRSTYNIFVTKRTKYLQNEYSKITPIEKAMIKTECVIMNNFIPNLVLLTQNKKFFNSDDQNIQFLIRGFITILQQLFMMIFSDIPLVKTVNTQVQIQQMQIGRNKYGMLLIPIQTEMEEFYKGTFKPEQMKLIFERRDWYSNLIRSFKKVVQNIYQHQIQDL